MPAQYVVSYLLLTLLALLALSCLFSALALLWQRARPAHRSAAADGASSFRRCEECSARWKATEQDRPSEQWLRRQQSRRRLSRTLTGSGPRRLPPSWDRCPHCLSTAVRASRSSRGSRAAG